MELLMTPMALNKKQKKRKEKKERKKKKLRTGSVQKLIIRLQPHDIKY